MYATSLHVDGEDAVAGTPDANVAGGSSARMAEHQAVATESSVSVSAPATTTSEEVVPGTPERHPRLHPPAALTPPRPSVRATDEMAWFASNVLPELEARSTESRASFHRPSSPPEGPVRPPFRQRAPVSSFPRPNPSRRSTTLDAQARFEAMLARVPPQPPVAAERSRARVEMEHLTATVESMGRELAALRALVETSVEVQFETQRAVRQELAAALARRRDDASRAPDASLDVADAVDAAVAAAARLTVSRGYSENGGRVEAIEAGFEHAHARYPPNAGTCVCCMEAPANALFYRCGHLCCCAACATKLHHGPARSRLCPCCRAPIVEVIRAYGASEGTGTAGTETAGTGTGTGTTRTRTGTGTRGKSEDVANVAA